MKIYLTIFVISFLSIEACLAQGCEISTQYCPTDCPFGVSRVKIKNECKCVCNSDPCQSKVCPLNSACQIKNDSSCINRQCTPMAYCTLKNKLGECPVGFVSDNSTLNNCNQDADCFNDYKCCSTSLNLKACAKPCYRMKCKCSSKMVPIETLNVNGCRSCLCVARKDSEQKSDCLLLKERGPCKAAFKRFYFDKESGQCKSFIYSGCKGNANKFLSKELCEQACLSKPVDNANKNILEISDNENDCLLDAQVGPCRASLTRYFFNKNTGKCDKFSYGGCKGNGNNFVTFEECTRVCAKQIAKIKQKQNQENVCDLRSEIGPCKASISKYYFNKETGYCEEFIYGGCQGMHTFILQ